MNSYKLCFLFAFVLLSHEALGFRFKRHWEDMHDHQSWYNWEGTGHFHKPNLQPPSTSKPDSGSKSENVVLRDCLQSCPVTTEFNPVCGTDNVTYDNPGRLQCAQSCGVNVSVLRKSRCPNQQVDPAA